jgi:hypothetical protein
MRDVEKIDIERVSARQASVSPALCALGGWYEAGRWKESFDLSVGLQGKGERLGMMAIIVRHGTSFIVTVECKVYVKIMLGIIYMSVLARLVKPAVFLYNNLSPLKNPLRRLPYSPILPFLLSVFLCLPSAALRRFFRTHCGFALR